MTPLNRTRAKSTLAKLRELSVAAPQVIAHRLTRMALAGPVLSARDRKEFDGMVLEKQAAVAQSWVAMATEGMRVNQALAASWADALWTAPFASPLSRHRKQLAQVQHALLGIASKGLAPVHRKAVANSKRLAKAKLR